MFIITLYYTLSYLLNYFWLSDDPDESASWYCDQHCFKIGSELIESIWDAADTLEPKLGVMATKQGISMAYRRHRHATVGSAVGSAVGNAGTSHLWHPLSVWNGLCKANMLRSLINAKAIFAEHLLRTGKLHSAYTDCEFLLDHVTNDIIDFNSVKWDRWWSTQNGRVKYTSKPKIRDQLKRREWCDVHTKLRHDSNISILDIDRNTNLYITEPPQCINEENVDFAGCKVDKDPVAAYRNYYERKCNTVSGGMRYYYTDPPKWLKGNIVTKNKKKIQDIYNYKKDTDGYYIVDFNLLPKM